MSAIILKSRLAPHMTDFIAHKKALGLIYQEQTRHLVKFDCFCVEKFPDEETVTREMLDI